MTRTRLLAAAGVVSLVLTACGGDDGGDAAHDDASHGDNGESMDDADSGGSGRTEPMAGQLHLGSLLPETGNLAFLGPPLFAGVDLAVQDINAAGGVGGHEVTITHTDSGDTSTDLAQRSVAQLVAEGATAIIGAAASGVSMNVIDDVVASGTMMISPSNTATDFTDYPHDGLYFRTAPSDVLQGRVLGELVLADGFEDVGLMVLSDPYGYGLADFVTEAIEEGGGRVVDTITYDPQATSFTTEVAQLAVAGATAIALIGFEESVAILQELDTQGLGPQDMPIYFVDGNLANFREDLPEGFLEGNKGTLPGSDSGEDFQQRLLEIDPDLNDFSYAGEAYDAVVLAALAAVAAGSVEPRAVAENMVGVSGDGVACSTFAECKELLEAGEQIDYEGVSGPIQFSPAGDVTEAFIGIYQYQEDNTYTNVDYRFGSV